MRRDSPPPTSRRPTRPQRRPTQPRPPIHRSICPPPGHRSTPGAARASRSRHRSRPLGPRVPGPRPTCPRTLRRRTRRQVQRRGHSPHRRRHQNALSLRIRVTSRRLLSLHCHPPRCQRRQPLQGQPRLRSLRCRRLRLPSRWLRLIRTFREPQPSAPPLPLSSSRQGRRLPFRRRCRRPVPCRQPSSPPRRPPCRPLPTFRTHSPCLPSHRHRR